MTATPHPVTVFADTPHHPVTTAAFVVLFWLFGGALVILAHAMLDGHSPLAGALAVIGAVFLAASLYTRFVVRQPSLGHCLAVGTAWIVLAIATELAVTASGVNGWHGLLGSPDRPLLRNTFLFVWIFVPALFARRD